MATKAQIENFINDIAPCAQVGYNTLGKVLPSVCIGMACTESGAGTSSIMRKYNAYLGQKVGTGKTATKYWDGKFFTSKTKEEYTLGTHTVIQAAFRAYNSMQQCVLNYYELLNTSLYKRVKAGVPYRTQMEQIKACGYMTSSTEVNTVCKYIVNYNLTRYDNGIYVPVTPTVVTHRTLKKGCKGDDVKALQTFLNLHGYPCGVADGIFGKMTEQAVKWFQNAYPECGTPDGIVGVKTHAVIDKMLG